MVMISRYKWTRFFKFIMDLKTALFRQYLNISGCVIKSCLSDSKRLESKVILLSPIVYGMQLIQQINNKKKIKIGENAKT